MSSPDIPHRAQEQSLDPDDWEVFRAQAHRMLDAANNNYALLPTSPYYGAASDGTNIGADIDSLSAADRMRLLSEPQHLVRLRDQLMARAERGPAMWWR